MTGNIGINRLQRQLHDYTTSLYNEGFLDGQFTQLQQLQDASNPNFVVNTVSDFFEDSERVLNDLTTALKQQIVDLNMVEAYVYPLKGSSSSIGAGRVHRASINFLNSCEQQNIEGCVIFLQQVKNEYYLVKSKLETLFKLQQQLVAAGGSVSIQ